MEGIIKTIVCLANSRKISGRSIVGREMTRSKTRDWIRPVSDRKSQEVSEYERQYEDGSDPKPLDIMDVSLIGPNPIGYQTENWLLNPAHYWKRRGVFEWTSLEKLVDPVADLWTVGQSTKFGVNDMVDVATANKLAHSLRLVKLERVAILVYTPWKAIGVSKRRVQAQFSFNQQEYKLWVTDPDYERKFFKLDDGEYAVDECYVVISIGEHFGGNCYKLVTTIMEPPVLF